MSDFSLSDSVTISADCFEISGSLTVWNHHDLQRLLSQLVNWLRQSEQQSTLTPLMGLETILRLLVIRRWTLLAPDVSQWSSDLTEAEIEQLQVSQRIWEVIAGTGEGMTAIVEREMPVLESLNPQWQGLFSSTLFFQWQAIPEVWLRRLVEVLASVKQSSVLIPYYVQSFFLPGLLGTWNEQESRSFRAVFLSQTLVSLMTRLLKVQPELSVYDPFCGVGQLLRAATFRGREEEQVWKPAVEGYGQLAAPELTAVAQLCFLLLGIRSIQWQLDDALSHPLLDEKGKIKQFDRIISAFPFLPHLAKSLDPYDRFQRFPFGIPASTEHDGLYVQQVLSSLKPYGRAVLLISAGFLFRQSARLIRRGLVEADLIRAIITLPNQSLRMYDRATLPMVILVLERDKPATLQGRWQLIDATSLETSSQREFEVRDIIAAIDQADGMNVVPYQLPIGGIVTRQPVICWVAQAQCQQENYNLNPPLYLPTEQKESSQDESLKALIEAEAQRQATQSTVDDCLRRLGWDLPLDF